MADHPAAHPTTDLGCYLLGALEPAERAAVEAHLRGCAACRDELSALAGLPGLLSRLSPEDLLEQPPADPVVLRRALAELTRRRARRRVLAVAASLVLVLAGGAAGVGLARPHPAPAARTVAATDARTGAQVRFALAARPWGTSVSVHLRHVPAGTRCRLVAVDRQGREQVLGSWQAEYGGGADVTAATDLAVTDLASLRVLAPGGAPLVTAALP